MFDQLGDILNQRIITSNNILKSLDSGTHIEQRFVNRSGKTFVQNFHIENDKKETKKPILNSKTAEQPLREVFKEFDKYTHYNSREYIVPVVSYREIHKEVTLNNYWIATRATFKAVKDQGDDYQEQDKFWNKLKSKKGVVFKTSPLSSSEYCIDGEKIYRFADHWGRVASCAWGLDDYDNDNGGAYTIAVCNLKDFKPNMEATTGYMSANPEYLDKVGKAIKTTQNKLKEFKEKYNLNEGGKNYLDKLLNSFEFKRVKYKEYQDLNNN